MNLTHFENESKKIRLASEERLRIRKSLERHMLMHPLPPIVSPYQKFLKTPAFAFAALVLVVGGGGTTLAAQSALPGHALYGVKVGVVEPLVGVFQVSAKAKAQWQVHLAETRLVEASTLAADGDLKDGTAAIVSAHVAAATARAAVEVASLSQVDPEAAKVVATELDDSLDANAHTVLALSSSSDASSTPVLAALISTHGRHMVPHKALPQVDEHSRVFSAAGLVPTSTSTTASTSQVQGDHFDNALELFTRVHAIAGDESTDGEINATSTLNI